MKITILTTGGTIDKIYFDQKSAFQVGDPQILDVLREANVTFEFEVVPLLRKDSLELSEDDRRLIREAIEKADGRRFVVTHGTDTMIRTAEALDGIPDKVIVLTGAMQPARFRQTDAVFNIGCAVMAVQLLPEGVYLAMNGQIFHPGNARKNVEQGRFEPLSDA
ncbi:MAG TPA: asparaginase domain-containing protein [Desulfuromonadales bacterium]|nr:asparaginase domain-containing protein [Desulfuromonadales bacterium]